MTLEQHNDRSYQKLVEDLAKECSCRLEDRPCDGLLAGGHCDSWGADPHPDPHEWINNARSDDEQEDAANNDFLT